MDASEIVARYAADWIAARAAADRMSVDEYRRWHLPPPPVPMPEEGVPPVPAPAAVWLSESGLTGRRVPGR